MWVLTLGILHIHLLKRSSVFFFVGVHAVDGESYFRFTRIHWRVCVFFGDFLVTMVNARQDHQEFQVPKMEGFLNLIYGCFGGGFSLT